MQSVDFKCNSGTLFGILMLLQTAAQQKQQLKSNLSCTPDFDQGEANGGNVESRQWGITASAEEVDKVEPRQGWLGQLKKLEF